MTTTPICILRAREVRERTGLSRSTIFLKIKKGEFPEGVSLGDRAVGWRSDEIDHWITSRVSAASQHVTEAHRESSRQVKRPPATSPRKGRKSAVLSGPERAV